MLSLEDLHLGYPGKFGPNHPIHTGLSALQPGARLTMRSLEGNAIGLFDKSGLCVGRLSRKGEGDWGRRMASVRDIRVLAMICRNSEQDTEEIRRERYQVPVWEIPVAEVVFENDSAD